MKKIYLLFAIFIILILFVGLTNVSAVDSSKWKTINIGDAELNMKMDLFGIIILFVKIALLILK